MLEKETTAVVAATDPEFQRKYRRLQRLYRRKPDDGVRLCIDEFGPLSIQPRRGKR